MNFLVVDDERIICDGTARRIEHMDSSEISRVVRAYSGREALAMLEQTTFHVLFTDIRMDGIDGLELVEQAKQLQPNLICVIVTAFDRFQYAQRAIRLGVTDYLVKPCSESMMRRQVMSAIERARSLENHSHRALDLSLKLQMLQGDKTVAQCFREQGLLPPICPIRLALLPDGDRLPDEDDAPWHYTPAEGGYALVDGHAGPCWLSALYRERSASVGLSLPGEGLHDMYIQASSALRFAWYSEAPLPVLCYEPQHTDELADLLQRLTQGLAAGYVPPEVCTYLAQAGPSQMAVCTALMEAACSQCGHTEPLLPGIGWRNVLDALQGRLRPQETEQIIDMAQAYMRTHMNGELDMASVANQMNLSYSYFSRVFHDKTGMTFSKYLTRLRMEEACRGMRDGERLVDIAVRLGYQNAANFSRAFSREFGLSPSKWLQRQRST